jgi:hypothetical protein
VFHETPSDGVLVDVVEFLGSLVFCLDVEVVVAVFPDLGFGARSREALLDDLHDGGEELVLRFRDEEMDVVRHDDIAVDLELVFCAGLFEDFEEGVSGLWSSEDGAVTETTEGDEVEVSGLLISN